MKKIQLPIELTDEDNVIPSRPDLGWLTKMLIIVIGAIILAIGGSYIFSHTILSYIDLETEKRYFGSMMIEEDMETLDLTTLKISELSDALRDYTIYIQESTESNAFATIGGNIIVTSSLLDEIENEEELVFILGHELAHIEHRDVIRSMAQSMPIILTLQSLGIDTGNSMTRVSSMVANYTSRENESKADDAGIVFLTNLGLNPICATGFFERNKNGFEKYTKVFSSHPISEERIKKLQNTRTQPEKPCTPMKKEDSSN